MDRVKRFPRVAFSGRYAVAFLIPENRSRFKRAKRMARCLFLYIRLELQFERSAKALHALAIDTGIGTDLTQAKRL